MYKKLSTINTFLPRTLRLHGASTRCNGGFVCTLPAMLKSYWTWNSSGSLPQSERSGVALIEVSRFSCGPAFLYATVLAACDVSTPDIPMDFPMLVASMAADSGAFSPAAFQEESLPCGWTMGDHGDRVEQDYINNSTSKQNFQ